MKAVLYHKYGSPDNLEFAEVLKPVPKKNEVLVQVKAVSLNSSDWEFLRGSPSYVRMWGLFKPKYNILGSDIAGVVVSAGERVKNFKPGDEVFGDIMYTWGGLAEFVAVNQDLLMHKPSEISFEDASAIPQAATVALQGLRDKGGIQSKQKVLINGGGGSTGTFAIQLAKYFGTEVYAVDKAEKQDLMLSLGADHVIDYARDDFTKNTDQYDLILDVVGLRSLFDFKDILRDHGSYVMLGGPVKRIMQTLLVGPWISLIEGKRMGILAHKQNLEDINYIIDLCQAGKVRPVIDQCFSFDQTIDAFLRLGEGRALGKVVIVI